MLNSAHFRRGNRQFVPQQQLIIACVKLIVLRLLMKQTNERRSKTLTSMEENIIHTRICDSSRKEKKPNKTV